MNPVRGEIYRSLTSWYLSGTWTALEFERTFIQLWINEPGTRVDSYDRFAGNLECALSCQQSETQLRGWCERDLATLAWEVEHGRVRPDQDVLKPAGRLSRIVGKLRDWISGRTSPVESPNDEIHDRVAAPTVTMEASRRTRFECYVSAVRWWVEGSISFAECEWIFHDLAAHDTEAGDRSWTPQEQRYLDAVDAVLSQPADHESARRACEAAVRKLEAEPENRLDSTV